MSLSEALMVNSSLTYLDIGLCFWWCWFVVLFHKQWYWWSRSTFIIRSIESKFISHFLGSGIQFYQLLLFSFSSQCLQNEWGRVIMFIWRTQSKFIPHWIKHEIQFSLFKCVVSFFMIRLKMVRTLWTSSIIFIRGTEGEFINPNIGSEFFHIDWSLVGFSLFGFYVFFSFTTRLLKKEHLHYLKHWRLIHQSLGWT